jgi:succinate dehydrogenase / fumarate reductase membrane anchor subunit
MHAGLRVVIEDYIHNGFIRGVLLLANLFVCTLTAALAILCILKVAFGPAVIPA